MVIIYDKETYITFNSEGKYRVIQEDKCIASTASKKDCIVRRKRLPKWCIKALEEGFWIEVLEFVSKGTNKNDFYLEVRGNVVKPQTYEETLERVTKSHDDVWYSFKERVIYSRERLRFKDFEKPVSQFYGWQESSKIFIGGITIKDYEDFKSKNPLPAKEEKQYEDFTKNETLYSFEDSFAIKEEFEILQPHTIGCWYEYSLDEQFKPFIKKNIINDNWSKKRVLKNKTTLSYIKKDVVESYVETDKTNCSSSDGMRKASVVTEFEITKCNVVLSDNSEHQVIFKRYLRTW